MKKLGRKKSNRQSLVRNLLTSLFLYESIKTTKAKASSIKSLADRAITRAKKGDLNSIRYLNSILFDKNATKKVLSEFVPRYINRKSGFTKIYRINNRMGDNAPQVLIELVDKKVFVDKYSESKSKVEPAKETVKK